MIRILSFLTVAAVLASVAVDEAEARGRRNCCAPAPSCCTPMPADQAALPADVPATAQADPNARRYSYEPAQQPMYVYPSYRASYRLDRYLLPKTDPRRFSTW